MNLIVISPSLDTAGGLDYLLCYLLCLGHLQCLGTTSRTVVSPCPDTAGGLGHLAVTGLFAVTDLFTVTGLFDVTGPLTVTVHHL
jgi:hypothetical protein